MKKFLHAFTFLFLNLFALAQTEISGIINQYTAVINIDACAGTLTVSDASGFEAGMDAILIQMQGAIINTSNNTNFGTIEDLRSAGLYERTRIRSVSGNIITLEFSLLNQYNIDGSIQLVSLPVYENAVVTNPVFAEVWNGQTGGVLALEVTDTLILNAQLSAAARGFRGGSEDITQSNNCNILTTANDYYYNSNNWRGAAKGDGIASIVAGREAGRGPQSTGGGGGNDHNTGGGGGGHIEAGGIGGENREPTALGCDGRFPGLGGRAIADLENRIFMGGGGGSGHENNNGDVKGGDGGGIVIVIARSILGNGQQVAAQGQSSSTVIGDGSGGGGAGGTVIIDAENIISPFEIIASGGMSGNISNNNENRCHGPGGGGSGGRAILPINLPINVIVSRGEAGQTLNSSANSCPNGNNGAQPGGDGLIEDFFGIPKSTQPNIGGTLTILTQPETLDACIDESLNLSVEAAGINLQYQWQLDRGDGNGFQNIPEGAILSGTQTPELFIGSVLPEFANASFRVEISGACTTQSIFSDAVSINITEAPNPDFDFAINVLSVEFENNSTNATSYEWDFGDGVQSNEANPTHAYAAEGEYEVTLRAFSSCDTVLISETILIEATPSASFSANATQGCAPFTITFQNNSSSNATSFVWILPGASPGFSTQRNPTVIYNMPGNYNVTLVASNATGIDTLTLENFIVVNQTPEAEFSNIVNDLNVSFSNNSILGDTFFWNFGDGMMSNESSPNHIYTQAGSYDVTLITNNICGSDTITKSITVGAAPSALFTQNRQNGCAPHLVTFNDISTGNYDTRIWQFPGGNPATSSDPNPTVRYDTPGKYDIILTITGALGTSTITQEMYITVLEPPTPVFDFSIENNTVTFQNASLNSTSLLWNFGDGNTSTQMNPVHTYDSSGVYTVTLNASNAYCGKSISRTFAVGTTDVKDLTSSGIFIFPNPASELLHIQANIFTQGLNYQLFSASGQILANGFFRDEVKIDLSYFSKGLYLLQLRSKEKIFITKIIKQ
ncbi:MAG: PKD domain-containing protein [Saprospiraceae bacterium]|nr:PKD domain-containing protein [Saprospiraceae bacterium]